MYRTDVAKTPQREALYAEKFTVLIEVERFDWQNCNSPVQGGERVALFGCPRVKMKEETFSMNKKLMAAVVARRRGAPSVNAAQVACSACVSRDSRRGAPVV